MSLDLTLQADFAANGRKANLAACKSFAGTDLKTGEHLDLTSKAETESFVKVKLEELEEKGGEVGAGPASAGAPAAPAPANSAAPVEAAAEPVQTCAAPVTVTPVAKPVARPLSLKRRRPEPTREDLRRWEALARDAFWMKNHPRMLEMLGHFQAAARIDRRTKAREVLTTRAPEPGRQWMTLTHVEHWSWGCKDRFNRIFLEDLHVRDLGSRAVYTFWNRPAMLEGQRLMELDHAFKNLTLDEDSSESSDEEAQ